MCILRDTLYSIALTLDIAQYNGKIFYCTQCNCEVRVLLDLYLSRSESDLGHRGVEGVPGVA